MMCYYGKPRHMFMIAEARNPKKEAAEDGAQSVENQSITRQCRNNRKGYRRENLSRYPDAAKKACSDSDEKKKNCVSVNEPEM